MAEYEVRQLGVDDVEAALIVRGNAFGNPIDDAQREVVRSRFERGGSFGIDLDGRLAGMLTVYPLGQFFGGASVPMGGIGSVAGAVVGGLVLGVMESMATQYIPGQFGGSPWKDVWAFVLLILVLVFRPQGLLGEKAVDRA